MGLISTPGLIFMITNIISLTATIATITLMHIEDDDRDETEVRLLITLYLDAVSSLLTLIVAFYGESVIDNDPDSGISTQMMTFIIIVIKVLLCIPMIVLMAMVKDVEESYYIILLVIVTVICNVAMFLSYPFAVQEEWF